VSKFKAGDLIYNTKRRGVYLVVIKPPDETGDYMVSVVPHGYLQRYAAIDLEPRYEMHENGVQAFMRVL
jgi:hypothetical protein